MSVYTDWVKATELVANNDPLDYGKDKRSGAQYYYYQQHKRFIQQIINYNQIQGLDTKAVGEYISERLGQLGELTINDKTANEISESSLRYLQQWVVATFEEASGERAQQMNQLAKELVDLHSKSEEEQKKNASLIKKKTQQLRALLLDGQKIENIFSNWIQNETNLPVADYGSLYTYFSGYMIRVARWVVQNSELFISDADIRRLAGYYKEIGEKESLLKFFQTTTQQGQNIQVKDIVLEAGKNNINDLLFIFEALNAEGASSQDVSLTGGTSVENATQSFGAQIKATDIKNVTTTMMKISHQAALKASFEAQGLTSGDFNKHSWACGVVYLGQLQNILQCFGQNNIVFISGNTRMFMHDFINYFRSQNLYLAFEMNKDGTIKNNSQVGLQRFIDTRKGALLNKFR